MLPIGGAAVAEWLERRLSTLVGKSWTQNSPEKAVAQAFLEADKTLLQPKGGFLGAFGMYALQKSFTALSQK